MSEKSSHMPLYSHTDSLHFLIKGSNPYSSICSFPSRPRSFSTSSSTGRPWVSHPALRSTSLPFMVWNRGIRSLMARVSIWPIWGRPLAVGGPSKNVKRSAPSRQWKHFSMMPFSFHRRSVSFSRSTNFMSVGTLRYMLGMPP